MTLSDFAELELIDHILGTGAAYTQPTNVYVKLHLGAPGEDCTANPAVETTRVIATFNAAAAGVADNDAIIEWTNVSTTETYSHFSIWDNLTAGNALMWGALTSSLAVTSGDDARFAVGQLTVTAD